MMDIVLPLSDNLRNILLIISLGANVVEGLIIWWFRERISRMEKRFATYMTHLDKKLDRVLKKNLELKSLLEALQETKRGRPQKR